ncbi:GMC family oxidoreductase [Rhabdaerophilum sp. SD176]|uniref:FAD-dependent oxidoreductase n=1 Tax=Rhabdaerophilum sp. SD176 TaxID=2983548 RepID=UPI0024DF703B|nr:GMC family oxidoreductase [Rhabdaerophilum sp. SD176]
MIVDAEAPGSSGVLTTQVCIIGAGPAGISLALRLAQSGVEVVLVAGGAHAAEPRHQALYAGEVADPALHSPTTEYRHRQFGGSSSTWGGRAMPFDPIDFEPRDWIEGAEWPIGFDDIAPHYAAAAELAEIGDPEFSAARAVEGGMRPMIDGLGGSNFSQDSIERFSCPTRFGPRYRRRIEQSPKITALLNGHATEILTSKGRASGVVVRTLTGQEIRVSAEATVIAAGGLETPRLLLSSQGGEASGIGNTHDQVGRNYLCHIAGTMGSVRFDPARTQIWHGYERSWDGVYCRRRLSLLPDVQREHRIGNVVMRLHHPRLPDPAHGRGILSAIYLAKPFISYEYSKRLHGSESPGFSGYLRHAGNVLREPFATAGFLMNWVRRRTLAERKFPSLVVEPRNGVYSLDIHAEQVPNPESRVTLSNERDALGMPRPRVDWRHRPLDFRTVSVALDLLRRDLADQRLGELTYREEEIPDAMLREGAYGGHHIGTARMSRSPRDGVVDGDGRVHGMDNLYIAGSAVFPTSSQANPTLTIIAFALRLADHLTSRLQPAAASICTEGAA